jgi:hypothetical protein
MKATVYKLLNADSKNWWYHIDLRKKGASVLARDAERKSIRSNIKTLRSATLMTIGLGGFTVYFQEAGSSTESRLQGYDIEGKPYRDILIGMGIPVIDKTVCEDGKLISGAISGPMPAAYRRPADPEPYHSFSYAPLKYYCEYWLKLGAKVYNVPTV